MAKPANSRAFTSAKKANASKTKALDRQKQAKSERLSTTDNRGAGNKGAGNKGAGNKAARNKATRSKSSLHRVTKRLKLGDRLSQLTVRAAERLLGQDGSALLRQSAAITLDPYKHIKLLGDSLIARVPDAEIRAGVARVSIVEMTGRSQGLQLGCDCCQGPCIHMAATLSTVLENKLLLGLSEEPDLREPIENLTHKELLLRALEERNLRAKQERMKLGKSQSDSPWCDYVVTSLESGKSYRVTLHGTEPGMSSCTCPDFRLNHLGTCKHILWTIEKVRKKFSVKELAKPYEPRELSLRVHYGETLGLKLIAPAKLDDDAQRLCQRYADKNIDDIAEALKLVRKLENLGHEVTISPDAEEYIQHRQLQERLQEQTRAIRADPEHHPLRTTLLRADLLPYQLDGIAFAVGAGRAVLADDMGLGKTIQGIGIAELFAQLADVQRVLIVCPASLKSQWASEIARFSDRDSQIVIGNGEERARQYANDKFFTIANYEQVVRDESAVSSVPWDLIILDEGQRIKNWESKTSRTFKSLKSPFALVLSGTPLENRLEELYTVVSFVNAQALGPAYRFFNRFRIADDDGRIKGYRRLDELRETLKPLLLRRTRQSVMLQLPDRTTEIVRVRPTAEQLELSDSSVARAAQIAAKKFLTEVDLLMIQKYLQSARMAANSTYLCDKQPPGHSSKLEVLDELLQQMADEPTRKIVMFSEWTTMLNLIEPLLEKHQLPFVRLDGSVPQKQRQHLVAKFQQDPACRCFLLTNAGSTGLNLQSANTVINIDLPWNPAVLEQRIARAHRMGQKNPVQVYLLVTEKTIEERMLSTLASKQELADAALDVDSNLNEVMIESGMEALKRRLEKLIGTKPTAPIDQSQRMAVEKEAEQSAQKREKVASAGGELLGAALNLVAQLIDTGSPPPDEHVTQITSSLTECIERDDQGRPQLRLALPNDDALKSLAQTLARLLVVAK